MDERLKRLKKAMQATTFKGVTFTPKQQQTVHQQLAKEQVLVAILASLITTKTGPIITQHLHQKGITAIQLNEGSVYTLLHQAELDGYVTGNWLEKEKYYELTKKGLNYLHKEQAANPSRSAWSIRFQEVIINEQ